MRGRDLLNRVPEIILKLILSYKFDYSKKAALFLRTSRFGDDDLINVVRQGFVQKKQKDEKKKSRFKYTMLGPALDGTPMYLVGKKVSGRVFVITFHEVK